MQPFDLAIEGIPGKDKVLADSVTRIPWRLTLTNQNTSEDFVDLLDVESESGSEGGNATSLSLVAFETRKQDQSKESDIVKLHPGIATTIVTARDGLQAATRYLRGIAQPISGLSIVGFHLLYPQRRFQPGGGAPVVCGGGYRRRPSGPSSGSGGSADGPTAFAPFVLFVLKEQRRCDSPHKLPELRQLSQPNEWPTRSSKLEFKIGTPDLFLRSMWLVSRRRSRLKKEVTTADSPWWTSLFLAVSVLQCPSKLRKRW